MKLFTGALYKLIKYNAPTGHEEEKKNNNEELRDKSLTFLSSANVRSN